MPFNLTLKVKPQEAADIEGLKAQALHQSKMGKGVAVLRKKSLDARSRDPFFLFQFDVFAENEPVIFNQGFALQNVQNAPEVHIVGCGPAGMFAALQCIELGLKPVIIERGKAVKERRRDLAALNKTQVVNPNSNYCFGEGGAGTYSDGKLYTRSNKRGPVSKVLQALVDHGAAQDILWEAHPHIGTNKLPGIIENIREKILACGGEILFNSTVTNFELQGNEINKIEINGNLNLHPKAVLLATGHSARDIFELLFRLHIEIEAKPFAIGVRLEHPQELIDGIQYKCETRGEFLPPSSYSLVEQVQGRGVFSFCMCPGGIIAPAATAPGEVVVNGWSPSKRNGKFANSGFVVTVDEKDFVPFNQFGELKAMHYQAEYEKRAFETRNNLTAPAQRIEDFIQKKHSSTLPECSYYPGISSRQIDEVLASEVSSRIREALVMLGKKMKPFRTNEAILVGVESRTSSPVRIPRDKEMLQHVRIQNLYPCAEGAGYAGGIMSAALDGMRVVEALKQNIFKNL